MLSNPPPTCKQRTYRSSSSKAERAATCQILIVRLTNCQAWTCAHDRIQKGVAGSSRRELRSSRKPPREKIATQHRENDHSSALLRASDGGIPLPRRMIYRHQTLNNVYLGYSGESGTDRRRIWHMTCLRDRHRFASRPRRRREAVGRRTMVGNRRMGHIMVFRVNGCRRFEYMEEKGGLAGHILAVMTTLVVRPGPPVEMEGTTHPLAFSWPWSMRVECAPIGANDQ